MLRKSKWPKKKRIAVHCVERRLVYWDLIVDVNTCSVMDVEIQMFTSVPLIFLNITRLSSRRKIQGLLQTRSKQLEVRTTSIKVTFRLTGGYVPSLCPPRWSSRYTRRRMPFGGDEGIQGSGSDARPWCVLLSRRHIRRKHSVASRRGQVVETS